MPYQVWWKYKISLGNVKTILHHNFTAYLSNCDNTVFLIKQPLLLCMKIHPKITSQLSEMTVKLKPMVQYKMYSIHKHNGCIELCIIYLLLLGRHMATFTLTSIAHSVLSFLKYCFWMFQRPVEVLWAPGKLDQVAVPSLLFLTKIKGY